ncbi:uncharacterized protein GLRG_01376 [Colletotrichum graminicola M1.001]|uniref:Uncharacterized protein n=1 Tax=Colletotrichum graminicola (strain M1.001 / M2 / FGSC 10212) TaxID=645133 RepID=E3Q5Y4_COLGM|nr:uncharacterized protein GLRG_01376 [Colletotrichum graminicola M1.001]EFQ26232.1 hypothetical protein GLRG_01376 [Colletotrichum graminicola M1.001]
MTIAGVLEHPAKTLCNQAIQLFAITGCHHRRRRPIVPIVIISLIIITTFVVFTISVVKVPFVVSFVIPVVLLWAFFFLRAIVLFFVLVSISFGFIIVIAVLVMRRPDWVVWLVGWRANWLAEGCDGGC